MGEGAADSDNLANPAAGVFFPAGGNRHTNGTAYNADSYGYAWSGSSSGAGAATYLNVNSGGASTNSYNRQLGFPVRCVRSSD